MKNLKILYTLTLVFDETLSQCPFLSISDLQFLSFFFLRSNHFFQLIIMFYNINLFLACIIGTDKNGPSLHLDSLSSFTKIIFTCLHFVLSFLPFAYSMFRNLSYCKFWIYCMGGCKYKIYNCKFCIYIPPSKFKIYNMTNYSLFIYSSSSSDTIFLEQLKR